jgi:hypothetical protein
MQHNNWGKDRDLLAEAVGKVFSEQHDPELEDLARDAMAPDPMEDPTRGVEDGEGGNIYENLQAFMEYHPETVEFLSSLLNEFETIMTDINDLEAPDQKIDAVDLGIHLNRLFPMDS